METMHTDDLLRLMHAMKETGVAVLQHGGLRLERETQGGGPSATIPAPLLETEPQDDKIPADLELEVRERQLDEMRLMDPFQYEQALLRDDIQEK